MCPKGFTGTIVQRQSITGHQIFDKMVTFAKSRDSLATNVFVLLVLQGQTVNILVMQQVLLVQLLVKEDIAQFQTVSIFAHYLVKKIKIISTYYFLFAKFY